MTDYCEQQPSGVGITFGKVIAGAALAVGAVLLAAAVFSSDGTVMGLGTAAKGFLFGEINKTTGSGGIFPMVGKWLGKLFEADPAKPTEAFKWTTAHSALLGTGLLGGGLAFGGVMGEKAEELQRQREMQAAVCGDPVPGGQAERLEMAAINTLMQARMAANSPEFMHAVGAGPARGV